jgi:hypothetical protein
MHGRAALKVLIARWLRGLLLIQARLHLVKTYASSAPFGLEDLHNHSAGMYLISSVPIEPLRAQIDHRPQRMP